MSQTELYENVYKQTRRFSFGKNWLRFIVTLTPEKIEEAKKSLVTAFPGIDFNNKTFLDIGSGSGIFSLAATQLGARVVSLDPDLYSIQSTQEIKKRFVPGNSDWQIRQGSVLDDQVTHQLGLFDIVYSWGVLHHTGNMWQAVDRAGRLVHDGGHFYLALYNHSHSLTEGTSHFWLRVKKVYNASPAVGKKVMFGLYVFYLWLGLWATRKNPFRYIRQYSSVRGMDFYSDVRDWLGGYPYEYASVEEVVERVSKLGFTAINVKSVRSIGCNEYHFVKN